MIIDILNDMSLLKGNLLRNYLIEVLNDPNHGPMTRAYLTAALDPSITYGVKGSVAIVNEDGYGFGSNAYCLLDRLAKRELTGNAAKKALKEFAETHGGAAVSLLNRCLNKDLRCGVGVTLINRVKAETGFSIKDFSVALCHPAEERDFGKKNWLLATKYDGIRFIAHIDVDGNVKFHTRSGKDIPALQPFAPKLLDIFSNGWPLILDGEAVASRFQETVSAARKKDADEAILDTTRLMVFDILDAEEFLEADDQQEFGAPLIDRLKRLDHFFERWSVVLLKSDPVQPVQHHTIRSWDEAQELFGAALDAGEEGVVLRDAYAPYRKARTRNWLKLKLEDTVDAEVVSTFEGQGKYEGMIGGYIVNIDGRLCNVGGGLTDEQRALHSDYFIGRIAEIKFNGKTDDGSLRHGRHIRFRDIGGEKA